SAKGRVREPPPAGRARTCSAGGWWLPDPSLAANYASIFVRGGPGQGSAMCNWARLRSVASGRVDHVQERLAGEVALQVATEEGDPTLGAIGLVGRCVGAYDRVRQVPERAVRRKGLVVERVEEGAADLTGAERGRQRCLFDDRAA